MDSFFVGFFRWFVRTFSRWDTDLRVEEAEREYWRRVESRRDPV